MLLLFLVYTSLAPQVLVSCAPSPPVLCRVWIQVPDLVDRLELWRLQCQELVCGEELQALEGVRGQDSVAYFTLLGVELSISLPH